MPVGRIDVSTCTGPHPVGVFNRFAITACKNVRSVKTAGDGSDAHDHFEKDRAI